MKPLRILFHRPQGMTLVESVVVIAIVAILATMAAPSFTDMWQRRRVEGIAHELATDLAYARSKSLMTGRPVAFTLSNACYTVWTPLDGSPCSCMVSTDCEASAQLKQVFWGAGSAALRLEANPALAGADYTLQFDPPQALPSLSDAAITISKGNFALQLRVNAMGRVHLCSPTGAKGQTPACEATRVE